MHVLDLTHPVTPGMQVYPGDREVAVETAATLAQDGIRASVIHLGTHAGTHVDAPSHVLPDGRPVDLVPLGQFHGNAHIVSVREVVESARVELSDVEPQLEAVRPGEVVLFDTGWSRYFGTPRYLDHPYLAPSIADVLIARGVRTVGVDILSPDPTPADGPPNGSWGDADLPFHRVFLGGGGVIVENLAGLSQIHDALEGGPDGVGAPRSTVVFSAMPLRLAGLDGSPVRAVAIVG
jgi:kynurenine formamidase